MQNLYKRFFTYTLTFLMLVSQSLACTAITLVNKNGNVVSGRTMEWGFDWNWKVIYIPKNTQHLLTAPNKLDLPKNKYISKYSILGTGLIKDDHTLLIDGQNSQGLSLSANYLPGFTQYQKVTKKNTKYASILEVTTFVLSQASNVKDAKQILKEYRVWSDKNTMVNGVSPEVHFLITDKFGLGIVVEYVDGKLKMYNVNSKVKVMTNAPTYDWHRINLRNYLNLDNKTINRVKIENASSENKAKSIQDIDGLGEGNGFLGLPGDYSPPSRFVKVAVLGYYSNSKGPKNESLVSKVTHILNNVDIPKGTVIEKLNGKTMFDHTAYVVIKDLNNNKLYIKSYEKPNNPVVISLNELDKNKSKAFNINIKNLPLPDNNITNKL